jgi:hypothetical protein
MHPLLESTKHTRGWRLHVVALSGGKDSTAMAIRLQEVEPELCPTYIITPTGDELPEMVEHWERLECMLGAELVRLPGPTLEQLIDRFCALPNWRQRWCTRMIKLEPAIAWYHQQTALVTSYVGLRADEEGRSGLESPGVAMRHPLREWGWGLAEVTGYLEQRGVVIPRRTDCARCYDQQIGEWWRLWLEHPDVFTDAERQEVWTGSTFRGPGRDTWPAALGGLRQEFERGRVPRGESPQMEMFGARKACRVCRM